MPNTLSRKRRAGLQAGIAVVVASLLAAACTSGSSSTSGSGGGGASGSLSVLASPVGPFANGWNPFSVSTSAYGQGAIGMIYEPLMQYNLLKVGHIYPWLATSWRWKAGGKQLVVHTRTGVKWSDGKPFSASDVAFTFNLMKKNPALNALGISFTGASAPSATETVITFPRPAYSQLFNISQVLIVPQHVWAHISKPATYSDNNPVGTGPYKLSSFTAQQFTLTANPHYWQAGLPKIRTLRFLASESNTTADLLLAQGQVDWSTALMPNYKTGFIDKNSAKNHISIWPIGNWYLCPNLDKYPFNIPAVRSAISTAIDRSTIQSQGEHGYYFATTSPTGLTLPRWGTWLAPQFASQHEQFNPGAAKSMLEKAGFKVGSNGMLQEPNGSPFAVTILGPTPYTDFMTDAQIMASDLQKAGIAATVNGESVNSWTNDYTTGNYQLTFCGQFTTSDPYSIYNYMLNSALTAPIGKPASGDFERYRSAQADAALNAAAATDNTAQLRKAYATIESLMVKDVPVIPLFDGGAWALYTTTHAVGWPTTSNPYEMNEVASPWDEVVALHLRPA